jgi:hypothetical protein
MTSTNLSPEAYELLDSRDEEQILAEIKGNIITEMFYSFPLEGRTVTGVSWVGTKEIARQYGGIDIEFIRVDETEESYTAVVKARDTRRGTSLLGTASQPKMMQTRSGERADRFAYTKAVSKAQRNAIRAIIPERFLIEMYEHFKKEKPEQRRKTPSSNVMKEPKEEADQYLLVKKGLEDELPLRFQDVLHVSDFNQVIYVQHSVVLNKKDFDQVDHVLQEYGAIYNLETNTWEISVK